MDDETEIQKHKIHQHKNRILIYNVYINKILTSNKVSFGKRGFGYVIGYKDSVFWLSHNQLWATIKGTAPFT